MQCLEILFLHLDLASLIKVRALTKYSWKVFGLSHSVVGVYCVS